MVELVAFNTERMRVRQWCALDREPFAGSRAVMERLDMQESADTCEHPQVPKGGPLWQHCFYRLSREPWVAQAGARCARLDQHDEDTL